MHWDGVSESLTNTAQVELKSGRVYTLVHFSSQRYTSFGGIHPVVSISESLTETG